MKAVFNKEIEFDNLSKISMYWKNNFVKLVTMKVNEYFYAIDMKFTKISKYKILIEF